MHGMQPTVTLGRMHGVSLSLRPPWSCDASCAGSLAPETLDANANATTPEASGSDTTDNPELPVLRTYGGQAFFMYRNDKTPAGTAVATDAIARLVPHVTWAWSRRSVTWSSTPAPAARRGALRTR